MSFEESNNPYQETDDLLSQSKLGEESRVKQVLSDFPDLKISILNTFKSKEAHYSHTRSYILYTIKVIDSLEVKRRYSEFESLRNLLVKLFPTKIVPPIPEKHSISLTTSSILGSMDSSPTVDASSVVDHRKRMLTVFLNRCLRTPEIRNCFLFIDFLDPVVTFHESCNAKGLATLQKISPFRISPRDPLKELSNEYYMTLPLPHSSSYVDENNEFSGTLNAFSAKVSNYETVLTNLYRTNKKIMKHFSDASLETAELGSAFNGLSLLQNSDFIEKIGQSFDGSYFNLVSLSKSISLNFQENLGEMRNLTEICKELVEFHDKKVSQLASIDKLLATKTYQLTELERQESECKRLEEAENTLHQRSDDVPLPHETNKLTPIASPSYFNRIPGFKRFNNVISSITDSTGDGTRKDAISELKRKIERLEKQHELTLTDNIYIGKSICDELEEFDKWLKKSTIELVSKYDAFLKDYVEKSSITWRDVASE